MVESMPYHGNTSTGIVAVGRSSSRSLESCRASNKLEAGRYRPAPISVLSSLEKCDQVVMGFLAAMEVGKFLTPPSRAGSAFVTLFLFFFLGCSLCFLFVSITKGKDRGRGREGDRILSYSR